MRGLRLLTLIALTGPLCVATQSAAGQQANFVAGTRTVAIYATVTGASGRLVTDLQREDFEVHDNGKPQELTLFANDIQPITVVILLDRSGSMRANFDLVERAAEEFVGAMLPADRARIGSFSNRIQIDPRDFTSDRDDLLRILRNELQEEGPTPLWNAINVGITGLLRQEGRRVILVFTDGADSPGNGRQNNVSLKEVTKRAEAENVMVYAVGLVGSNPQLGGYRRSGFSGFGGSRSSGRRRGDRPDEGLLKLATATGGGYFELSNANDLAGTFKRIAEELHHQYALGFTPTNLDGKAHSLRVQVREEAATVRARKSYIASKQ
jgi:Ca-activated chloride channel family protein